MKQLSIDVAHEAGELEKVMGVIAEANVDIRALSLGHCPKNSKLRRVKMIVNDLNKAVTALAQKKILAQEEEVLVTAIEDHPGGLDALLKVLGKAKLNIEHIYGFVSKVEGKALTVLSFADAKRAREVLAEAKVAIIEDTHQASPSAGIEQADLSDYVGGNFSWWTSPRDD